MLRWATALHNFLFDAQSLCLIDQTQTFSLAFCPIYTTMLLFCTWLKLKKTNKPKDGTIGFIIIPLINYYDNEPKRARNGPGPQAIFKPCTINKGDEGSEDGSRCVQEPNIIS